MNGDNLCQYLEWDSDFFGYRIARCTVSRLNPETIETVMNWCQLHYIDCLYFLSDASDEPTMRLAEDNHFRLMDIRLTLEKRLEDTPAVENRIFRNDIRLCISNDIPALRTIAGVSYRDSRFYYDSNFSASLCDALYETWIEKSCLGYADAVLVAEVQGQPVGYCSCHLRDQAGGEIGLVGVGSDQQGNGLGQKLIDKALGWFAEQGVTHVEVVTQARNCSAQRLYQRCGFLTTSVQFWYHRWFSSHQGKWKEFHE